MALGTSVHFVVPIATEGLEIGRHSSGLPEFSKNMIALKKRLESLEISTEQYHQRMAAQAQKELGLVGLLPLPPCSDIEEARIRLKRMVDALVKLPLGMNDPAVNEIVEEFRSWVRSEHARQKVINGQ